MGCEVTLEDCLKSQKILYADNITATINGNRVVFPGGSVIARGDEPLNEFREMPIDKCISFNGEIEFELKMSDTKAFRLGWYLLSGVQPPKHTMTLKTFIKKYMRKGKGN